MYTNRNGEIHWISASAPAVWEDRWDIPAFMSHASLKMYIAVAYIQALLRARLFLHRLKMWICFNSALLFSGPTKYTTNTSVLFQHDLTLFNFLECYNQPASSDSRRTWSVVPWNSPPEQSEDPQFPLKNILRTPKKASERWSSNYDFAVIGSSPAAGYTLCPLLISVVGTGLFQLYTKFKRV